MLRSEWKYLLHCWWYFLEPGTTCIYHYSSKTSRHPAFYLMELIPKIITEKIRKSSTRFMSRKRTSSNKEASTNQSIKPVSTRIFTWAQRWLLQRTERLRRLVVSCWDSPLAGAPPPSLWMALEHKHQNKVVLGFVQIRRPSWLTNKFELTAVFKQITHFANDARLYSTAAYTFTHSFVSYDVSIFISINLVSIFIDCLVALVDCSNHRRHYVPKQRLRNGCGFLREVIVTLIVRKVFVA